MPVKITGEVPPWSAERFRTKAPDMKRIWTIVGVADVASSCRWYQSLFGQPETSPGHDYFGQILDSDGTVLLCLHEWGAHEYPSLKSPDHGKPCQDAQVVSVHL